ncbi:RNA-dependent RNA polymerase 1 [Mucor ambiguus]|uniref:RNA-dependent RNA polymerase n=1 Tax=Mucor ambiguus TaxID=91626 RepID=A0A0C9MK39_9FUNG|nr:RNA-dependent RNA polymerase 1 [Mucor ambiguus]
MNKSKTIRVSDLNPLTIPPTLMEYFDKFETVRTVTLEEDDNGGMTGTAIIVFQRSPSNPIELTDGNHKIDGRKVRIVFIRNEVSDLHQFKWDTDMLFPRSFSMGFMRTPKNFIDGWSSTERDLKFEFNYTLRRINILFSHLGQDYKVEFKFKDVAGEIYAERERNTTILTIPLRYPGTFWKRNLHVFTTTKRSSSREKKWERVTLIPWTKDFDISTPQRTPFLPVANPNALDLGNWLTFRLVFSPQPRFAAEFEQKLQNAANFNLVPRDLGWKMPFIKVDKLQDIPKPFGHKERCELGLDFDVLYMLESVISYHYINEYNLDDEFYSKLVDLDPDVICAVLQMLSEAKQRIWNPLAEIIKIWSRWDMKVIKKRSVPSHCALLRKIIVTPTHIYIQTPSVETTNRVIRHYKDQSEGFIRVQFMDEGYNRVGGAGNENLAKDSIYLRIFTVLKRGVQIGKKRYEFLAFSSSQLREQGCWFFAPTTDINAHTIRTWMGVFSHEKVVAKHAIRMGQCFSSTRPVYTLEEDEVEYIDDVKRNGYTFSDGVGKISPELAKEVAFRLELKQPSSAFQFRLGGAKGVLTIDERLANTKIKVQLRPSQIKFESKHLTLEVIRTSTYIHGYLNRQVITLLSSLGIKDQVFMEFMNEMLQDVDRLFSRPEEAVRVLLGNVDEAGTALFMVPLIRAGFLERGDPYIKNLLNLFRVNILKDLKKKAKIVVPQGAYLLGVMDETGTLEEGEVFVQFHDTSGMKSKQQLITGNVVVFRNPCFHPGDVRIVKAVDREELHYLVDVIVFSSKGMRDIPSMCSGGDLDGDDYTVYWDPRLIPSGNYEAMDYTPAPPKLVDEVKIKDIIKFFVNYISNDNLGQIANAHLATADQSPIGARDGRCIRLAQLHSEAVDFPKSGKPAKLTSDLRVQIFPDFMQKKDRESYQSKKVLGQIFRSIDKSNYKNYKSTLTSESEFDVRLRVPNMELYIQEARELRATYNNNLSAHMNQFGVQTEAEICSGYVIKWLKKGKSKNNYQQHEYTMRAIKSFKSVWKKTFFKEFKDGSGVIDPAKRPLMEAKAAAWYYVTYHPNERERDMSLEGGFFSFPWIVSDLICEIAKRSKQKDELDIIASYPFTEEEIRQGKNKLDIMRQEVIIVEQEEDDDDDDEEIDSEHEVDEGDDDLIYVGDSSKPYPTQANHPRSTNRSPASIMSPGFAMPSRRTIVHSSANATDEELIKALDLS